MKHRNSLLVFFLPLITFGIYQVYWLVSTKKEMNIRGQKIPTAWILLIPIVGPIWFYWVFSKGAENVTNKDINSIVAFLLLYLLGSIGSAIIQDSFNHVPAVNIQSFSNSPATPPAPLTPASLTPIPTVQTVAPQQPVTPNAGGTTENNNFTPQAPVQIVPTNPHSSVNPTIKPPIVSG
jgi:hypothetical protein